MAVDLLHVGHIKHLAAAKQYGDILVVKDNLYIEIKGYFRADALEKWEWFCKEYPNSELWNEKKLKDMRILK